MNQPIVMSRSEATHLFYEKLRCDYLTETGRFTGIPMCVHGAMQDNIEFIKDLLETKDLLHDIELQLELD